MARFEELDVWKKSVHLSVGLDKELGELRDFGFRDQITRAGFSIPSNIAEGYERNSRKELANFLNYAKGSAGELRTQIYIGIGVGYISPEIGKNWISECEEISKNALRTDPFRQCPMKKQAQQSIRSYTCYLSTCI